jgi:serine/threonine protein phosphatase PrpC
MHQASESFPCIQCYVNIPNSNSHNGSIPMSQDSTSFNGDASESTDLYHTLSWEYALPDRATSLNQELFKNIGNVSAEFASLKSNGDVSSCKYSASVSCSQGFTFHKPNQDRALLVELTDPRNSNVKLVLFGVFDGHGLLGHLAADLCVRLLPSLVNLHFCQSVARGDLDNSQQIPKVLERALKQLQEMLIDLSQQQREDVLEHPVSVDPDALTPVPDERRWEFGTTANIGLLDCDRREIYLANIGDSMAMVYAKTGNAWSSSQPLAEHGDKIDSFSKLGSEVPIVRLNMSRALGHLQLRKAGLSTEPEIAVLKLNVRKDYVIVCGSDGLWRGVTSQQVEDLLVCSLDAYPMLKSLMQTSFAFYNGLATGYSDNISSVILQIPKL